MPQAQGAQDRATAALRGAFGADAGAATAGEASDVGATAAGGGDAATGDAMTEEGVTTEMEGAAEPTGSEAATESNN